MNNFNERIRQILLLLLIIFLTYLCISELVIFLPGLLGAITFYILSRASYFQLVFNRKWRRGRAAGLYILYYLLILGIPIFLAIVIISPKLNVFLENPTATIEVAKASVMEVQRKLGFTFISAKSLTNSLDKLSALVPTLINSTANLVSNLGIMLFLLYYMLYYGTEMERYLNRIIPLRPENISTLASETKTMVKANALGIPLISLIQGVVASLGFFIFGVKDWALWGFLTGIFAFFPVVGTMIVWVPLVILTYATGTSGQAIGILLYSFIITGNIDYVARITLLKKLGNVHPVITILGVIIGLGLFGFIGLVFGPLLLNYVIVLFEIYSNEFVIKDQKEEKEIKNPPE